MINQKENKSKKNKGVKISNARIWASWDRGIYFNSGGSPAKRAKAGGQKGRGFRSVMSPGIFARPADFGGVLAAPQARQSVNFVQNRFGFGCINALLTSPLG